MGCVDCNLLLKEITRRGSHVYVKFHCGHPYMRDNSGWEYRENSVFEISDSHIVDNTSPEGCPMNNT